MRDNYAAALKRLLVHEGGYVNHPADPGGATNKGVTKRVYDAYRVRKDRSIQSVKLTTADEVAEIYREQYANKVWYDKLPSGIDEVVFDGAVNSGVSQSVKWLQRALGNVRVDGVMGNATLSATLLYPNHDRLVNLVCDRRMAFLKALKTWRVFGKGWTRRVSGVRRTGLALASGGSVAIPVAIFAEGGNAKANVEDAKAPPSKAIGDALAGGGVVTTVLEQVTGSFSQLSWIPGVDKVVSLATAIGGLMIVGGLLYRWYQKSREDALLNALDQHPTMPVSTNLHNPPVPEDVVVPS